jgi:hypothetical protein
MYYIFKPSRFGGRELFWTGKRDLQTNEPTTTESTKHAAGFTTARSAYECGGLNKMYWWKVGKRLSI